MIDLNDPRNADTPLFPVSIAAQAARNSVGTVRMWFQRERMSLHKMDAAFEPGAMPEKPGLPRLLTFRTIATFGAAGPLIRQGADVARAYQAAKAWTHTGEGWDGRGGCPREPLGLFKEPAWTVLVHYGDGVASVIPVEEGTTNAPPIGPASTLAFRFSDLILDMGAGRVAPTLVFLNDIDMHVRGVCERFLRA